MLNALAGNLCRRRVVLKFTLLFSLVCFFSPSNLRAVEYFSDLVGSWRVVKVKINQSGSRRTGYELNDPRLIGRIFTFSRADITNDTPEGSNCKNPTFSTESVNIVELIGGSLGGNGFPTKRATPADYGLRPSPAQHVKLMRISCEGRVWEGGLGAGDGPNGAWMFLDADKTLVMRWYDETILILKK